MYTLLLSTAQRVREYKDAAKDTTVYSVVVKRDDSRYVATAKALGLSFDGVVTPQLPSFGGKTWVFQSEKGAVSTSADYLTIEMTITDATSKTCAAEVTIPDKNLSEQPATLTKTKQGGR